MAWACSRQGIKILDSMRNHACGVQRVLHACTWHMCTFERLGPSLWLCGCHCAACLLYYLVCCDCRLSAAAWLNIIQRQLTRCWPCGYGLWAGFPWMPHTWLYNNQPDCAANKPKLWLQCCKCMHCQRSVTVCLSLATLSCSKLELRVADMTLQPG
jgi:hypothetical protein